MSAKVYVIYDDSRDIYFIHLGLGLFWECGSRERAREFTTRKAAATMLTRTGKNRQGWRVLTVERKEA